ncbi:MAG: UDP-N-acetylmuramoyl-tripeptide--D-alanyl-D-alanine ligase [Vulcanibacillus sp.]
MKLNIQEITKCISGELINTSKDLIISGVSTDSRKIKKGDLYIPLKGERYDGHSFVLQAIEAGAIATLWQEDIPLNDLTIPTILVPDTLEAMQNMASWYRQLVNPIVIGVTGSNGKTTTKDLITATLVNKYRVHKTKGNLNNHIGVPLTLLNMSEDTDVAVIEMGMSNLGEIEKLSLIANPDIAVVTNIGESHIEFLKTKENIVKAKLEIIKGLKEDGLVILPGEEPLVKSFLAEHNLGKNIIWVGETDKNDFYPLQIKINKTDGITFTDSLNDQYYLPLIGVHNVINALMAIKIAKQLSVKKQDIQDGLDNIELTGMRLEKIHAKNGALILNDAYNSSPTSLKASLQLLDSFKQFKQKIAILGDMLELGENAELYHEEIGKVCAEINLDYLIVTGKLGKSIVKAAKENGLKEHKIKYFEDINLIPEFILKNASSKAIILVKASRGIKLEMVVNQIRA